MSKTQELKKCPFCGGKVEIIHCRSVRGKFSIAHSLNFKRNCPIANGHGEEMGVYFYDTKEDAAEAWNKRVLEERSIFMTEQEFKELTAAIKASEIPLDLQKILQRLVDKDFNEDLEMEDTKNDKM